MRLINSIFASLAHGAARGNAHAQLTAFAFAQAADREPYAQNCSADAFG